MSVITTAPVALTLCTLALAPLPVAGVAQDGAGDKARADGVEAEEEPQGRPISLEELIQTQVHMRADAEKREEEGEEAEGPVRTIHDAVIARDGTIRWLVVSAADLLDPDGRSALVPMRFVTIDVDGVDPKPRVDLDVSALSVLPGYEPDMMIKPTDLDRYVRILEGAEEREPVEAPEAGDDETVAQESASARTVPRYILASDLIALGAKAADEECGKVEDAAVDPLRKKVDYLLIGGCVSTIGSPCLVVPTAVTTWTRVEDEVLVGFPRGRDTLEGAVFVPEPDDTFPTRDVLQGADTFFGL